MSFQNFFQAYLVCALWSSNDESDESGGNPMDDNYSLDDIAEETIEDLRKEAETFYNEYHHLFDGDDEQAGHDFWLTRNGHGAGFWDGDWPKEVGETLTKASTAYGNCHLYVGDDNKIYAA